MPVDYENLLLLQECLSLGKPLLIENVEEELDPVLDTVLDRKIIRKGKACSIILGDKEVRAFMGRSLM